MKEHVIMVILGSEQKSGKEIPRNFVIYIMYFYNILFFYNG